VSFAKLSINALTEAWKAETELRKQTETFVHIEESNRVPLK